MPRIALISDIHGNIDALEAVLADIETQAVDEIACLGDVVGYWGSSIGVHQVDPREVSGDGDRKPRCIPDSWARQLCPEQADRGSPPAG